MNAVGIKQIKFEIKTLGLLLLFFSLNTTTDEVFNTTQNEEGCEISQWLSIGVTLSSWAHEPLPTTLLITVP